MSDILVLHSVSAVCQDGVTREGGALVVRDSQYVWLDADGAPLTGESTVVELIHGVTPLNPPGLSMITARHGPIFS